MAGVGGRRLPLRRRPRRAGQWRWLWRRRRRRRRPLRQLPPGGPRRRRRAERTRPRVGRARTRSGAARRPGSTCWTLAPCATRTSRAGRPSCCPACTRSASAACPRRSATSCCPHPCWARPRPLRPRAAPCPSPPKVRAGARGGGGQGAAGRRAAWRPAVPCRPPGLRGGEGPAKGRRRRRGPGGLWPGRVCGARPATSPGAVHLAAQLPLLCGPGGRGAGAIRPVVQARSECPGERVPVLLADC